MLVCLVVACTGGFPSPSLRTHPPTVGRAEAELEADETETDGRAAHFVASSAARRVCHALALVFRHGCEAFYSGEYETAATALLGAVNVEPEHEDSGVSLWMIAQAFHRLERHEACARIFQRLIDELGPRTSSDPARDELMTAMLGEAYFYVGLRAAEREHYEEALFAFRVLADSPRFGRSTSEQVRTYRRDATANVAQLLERLDRYPEAVRYAQRIIADSPFRDEIWREARERILRLSPAPGPSTP